MRARLGPGSDTLKHDACPGTSAGNSMQMAHRATPGRLHGVSAGAVRTQSLRNVSPVAQRLRCPMEVMPPGYPQSGGCRST